MCGYEWDISEEAGEEPCPDTGEGHVCALQKDDDHIEHECPCGASQYEFEKESEDES